MTKYIYILTLILVGFVPLSLFGQINTLGTATPMAQCGCYELTNTANGGEIGGIYENTAIDITNPFNLKFTVNFGDNNFGGDGVAFSLQANPFALGGGQWGLGIQGVSNEVHIEFDTRYSHIECSCSNNDNGVDHLGLMRNGSITHVQGGPSDDLWGNTNPSILHPLIGGVSNIEDGLDHKVEISYDGALALSVKVDDAPAHVFTLQQTLQVELGSTTAQWGWTGSTPTSSSVSNTQTVCLANMPTFDYSIVNCQLVPMDFNANTFSFYSIATYQWYIAENPAYIPVNVGNTQTVNYTFTNPGQHVVTIETEDINGCVGIFSDTIGVGFEIVSGASQDTVCDGETVDLTSEAVFYVPPTCTYTLMMGDLFCDGWAGSEIEVYVNGNLFGTYSPPNVGCGGAGWEEFVDLELPDGASVDINFIYAGVFGSEIYYQVYGPAPSTNVIIDVPAGSVTGDISDNFSVDCGLTATTYSYQWNQVPNPPGPSGPATDVWNGVTINHPSADFEVQITNNQTGCVVVDTVTVMTYDTVYADVSGTATICDGETTDITFTLTGTPPFDLTYMTPTGQVVENGITGNSFVVTVSDDGNYFPVSIVGSGCTGNVSSNQATVTVIPLPNINIGSSATYCVGETMTDLVATSANGGSIFWWDNQANVGDTTNAIGQGTSLNIDVLGITTTTTFYAQEFSIPDGCGGSVDQVVITILPIPTAPVVSGTQEYCDGDTYTPLTVSLPAGSSGIWTDGMGGILANNTSSYTPQNLVVGPNTVCVMEDNGTCTGDSTCIAINLKPTPTAPGVSGDTSYCTNDVITPLTGTANLGGFITWSTGDIGNQITPGGTVGTTTYCANETLNGCTGPDSCVNVTVYVDPSITVPTSATICIGDSVLICADNNGIFPPDVIQWSHGPTDECIYLGPPSDEQYVVCLTNPACGTVCDTIDIIVKPLPVVTAGDDQTTGLGGEVTMWADGALSYDWSPFVTCQDANCENVYAVPSATTTYIVTGTDENGCVNTDSVVITINGEMQLYVPNVFSPNADGVNDRLFVMGPRLSQFSWAIFDRQGKKLYESTDQKAGWNGTYNGEPLPQQVVTYVIQGVDVLGREVKTGGNVMLSR